MSTPSNKSTEVENTPHNLTSLEEEFYSSEYGEYEEYIPMKTALWACVDDISQDLKYLSEDMEPFKKMVQMEDYSSKRAKRYLQAFIDEGSEYEIYAVYELVKIHNMLIRHQSVIDI